MNSCGSTPYRVNNDEKMRELRSINTDGPIKNKISIFKILIYLIKKLIKIKGIR